MIVKFHNKYIAYGFFFKESLRYPLPTPATYPNGAGTPKKCFLFRVDNDVDGTAMFTNLTGLKLFLVINHIEILYKYSQRLVRD